MLSRTSQKIHQPAIHPASEAPSVPALGGALAVLALVALALLLLVPSAAAATRCVGPAEGCDTHHANVPDAIAAAQQGDVVKVRGASLGALDIPASASDLTVDARLNSWGTDDWREVRARIADHGAGNRVLFTPFLRASDGLQDPPPIAVVPGTHCSTAGFAPLSIGEALGCAHPGGTILVRPSANPVDPTPYLETFTISRNRVIEVDIFGDPQLGAEDELLAGLTLCSSPVGSSVCDPQAAGTVIDGDDGDFNVVNIEAPGVTVRGFTIRNPMDSVASSGLRIAEADARVLDNVLAGEATHIDAVIGITLEGIYGVYIPAGATNYLVEGNEIRNWDHSGILVREDVSGPGVLRGNRIHDNARSGVLVAAHTDLSARPLIVGNTIGPNILRGVLLMGSSGTIVEGNDIILSVPLTVDARSGAGVLVSGAHSPRIRTNTFTGHSFAAVAVVDDIPDAGPADLATDVVLRENTLGPNTFGLHIGPNVGGRTIDARLNDWGTYQWRTLPARVLDEGVGNRVLQIPFLLPDGSPEPPLPEVVGGTHCSSSGFVPLDIGEALGCAHPGAKVLVRPSAFAIDPTPYLENVVVSRNRAITFNGLTGEPQLGPEDEDLVVVLVCSSPVGSSDCTLGSVSSQTVIDGSAGAGPAVALAVDGAELQGFTLRGTSPLLTSADTTGVRVTRNALQVTPNPVGASHGIALLRTTDAYVFGNRVTGNMFPGSIAIAARASTAPVIALNTITGSGTGVYLAEATGGVARGNVIRVAPASEFGGASLGVSFFMGVGDRSQFNTFDGPGVGLLLAGTQHARSLGDNWLGTPTGIELRASIGGVQPVGARIRQGHLQGAAVGVALEDTVNGVTVDARLNNWGVYQWRLLAAKVRDDGAGNRVLQIPFLLPDGTHEPPDPTVVGGAHCSGSGFIPLSIAEALGCAHPGGQVLVRPSAFSIDPTPYLENVVVHKNRAIVTNPFTGEPEQGADGVDLVGVQVCASPVGSFACAGSASDRTVIDASAGAGPAVALAVDAAQVQAFTLRGASPLLTAQDVSGIAVLSNAFQTTPSPSATHGVDLLRTTDASVVGNAVRGNAVPGSIAIAVRDSTRPDIALNTIVGSGTGIYLADTTKGMVRGNVLRTAPFSLFGGNSLGVSFFQGRGDRSLGNTFDGPGVGLLVMGSRDARSLGDTWASTPTAILFRASGSAQPLGAVIRQAHFPGSGTAIALEGSVNGVTVDARLNDWGAYQWRALPSRVRDDGVGNRVLQIPFLLPDGSAEPPVPEVVPGIHCSGSGFLPLSIGEALGCAHPGGKVLVRPSASSIDPTPYLENVVVHTNRVIVINPFTGEPELGAGDVDLVGVQVCASPVGSVACDTAPSARTVLDGSAAPIPAPAAVLEVDRAVLQGLTMRGSDPLVRTAAVDGATVRFNHLQGEGLDAAVADGGTNAVLRGNVVDLGAGAARGIAVLGGTGALVDGNAVQGSGDAGSVGIALLGGSDAVASANQVDDAGTGILVSEALRTSVRDSVIDGATGPIPGSGGAALRLDRDTVTRADANQASNVEVAVDVVGSAYPRITRLGLMNVDTALLVRPAGAVQPISPKVRESDLGPAATGVRVDPATSGVTTDARLNQWGTDDWSRIAGRIVVGGAGNRVLYLPFLRASDGRQDPPPIAVIPGSHCSGAGFVPLSLEEALGCAHPGGLVLARPSLNAANPTPYLENLVILRNKLVVVNPVTGEPELGADDALLTGLSLCAEPSGTLSCEPHGPDARTVLDGSAAPAPAVRVLVGSATVQGFTMRGASPLATVESVGGATVARNELRVPQAASAQDGLVLTSSADPRVLGNVVHGNRADGSHGIRFDGGSGVVASGNTVDGSAVGIAVRDPVSAASLTGNQVSATAGSPTVGILLLHGSGHTTSGNRLSGLTDGLVIEGASGVHSDHDAFPLDATGVRLRAASQPTGVMMRFDDLRTAVTGLALEDSVSGVAVDAILNCWGADTVSGVRAKIADAGTGNSVASIPFLEDDCLTPILPPVASFTIAPDPTTRIVDTVFTDTSAPGSRAIANRHWEFGDGAILDTPDAVATHRYGALGTFTVTLVVRNAAELESTATGTVTVINIVPLAAFTWSPDPANRADPTQFTDLSTDLDGDVAKWLWDFGDGSGSKERDPAHTYTQLGSFTVRLIVTDNDGDDSLPIERILTVVNLGPLAAFTTDQDPPMAFTPTQFRDRSTDRDGSIVAWAWEFGDGATSTEQDPIHVYMRGGAFKVNLTVRDDDGATATTSRLVFVCAPGLQLNGLLDLDHLHVDVQGCIDLELPPLSQPAPGSETPTRGAAPEVPRRVTP